MLITFGLDYYLFGMEVGVESMSWIIMVFGGVIIQKIALRGYTVNSYKGWTAQERNASYRKTKKAIKDGIIPPPEELGCKRCGQKKGIIHYHNHDYSDPIKYLEPLCWRCHMIEHSSRRNPKACEDYWESIKKGRALNEKEMQYVVALIMRWIEQQNT